MKVGIITQYFGSLNYGGVLQSHALVQTVENLGYSAEQISYSINSAASDLKKRPLSEKIKRQLAKGIKSFFAVLFGIFKKKARAFFDKRYRKELAEAKSHHKRAFGEFVNGINHSSEVYSAQTVAKCADRYDAFITGSDQVWNLTWYVPAYFLDFVPSEKTKISYAASIGMKSLDDEQKQIFKNSLKDYQAVSVREEASTEMLKEISPHTPQYVLDPTLLLSAQEWDEISAERVIEEKYVFCYFLGDDRRERKIAEKYARKRGLKIVTFPHIANKVVRSDFHFGDIRMFDATPEQFISLIKHAEYVFTDSFHATVFSNIYHKEYFVFERAGRKGMGSRIYSLTGLFESEERFCDTAKKARLKYIENLPKLDYSREFPHFEEMKEKSMDYLKRNLQAAAERLSESEE